eukprot:740675-Hanusia_phi.AAC.1
MSVVLLAWNRSHVPSTRPAGGHCRSAAAPATRERAGHRRPAGSVSHAELRAAEAAARLPVPAGP